MRTFFATILIWAILIGFLATGVKVMATSPTPASVQAVEIDNGVDPIRQELNRDAQSGNHIQPADHQAGNLSSGH